MLATNATDLISVEDYLNNELSSKIKHEFIDGYIHAMAGASANHDRIAGNIYAEFRNHLNNSPCEPFGSDMKIKVGTNFFYPDLIVDCDFDESQAYYTESPILIIEVLSKSTRQRDETTKLMSYINIPSLQEYVLIEQDFVDIQIIRRKQGWLPNHYFFR